MVHDFALTRFYAWAIRDFSIFFIIFFIIIKRQAICDDLIILAMFRNKAVNMQFKCITFYLENVRGKNRYDW